ncbi:MAG: hypothetical protein AB1298_05140 [Bacteroidota bacterium]
MLKIKKAGNNLFLAVIITTSFFLASCSKDNNPLESGGSTSKVAGRISPSTGSATTLSKSGNAETTQAPVQDATVILAQVQADGSLKTVSTKSVQTDAAGKFVVETNLSGVNNLVVVATKGEAQWKAIVSSTVQSGNTVYAPPLNMESTTETNLYIKLVSQGRANSIDATDLKILLDAQGASYLRSNANAEAEFINALQAQSQATAQAAGNSYFGLSSSQIQAVMLAKAEAKAKFDAALYNAGESEEETENEINNFEGSLLSVYTKNATSANVYAKLMRIGVTAFVNATTSMSANGRVAIAKSFYKRYAFVLSVAMKEQFQSAGASSAQINAVASAGAALYSSIKTSADLNQIANAFVQYHSSIKSQIKVTLASYADAIEIIDSSINATASSKTVLNASLIGAVSIDAIINAYVTFFNTVKSTTQATLTGASSEQVSASSQILILANMN